MTSTPESAPALLPGSLRTTRLPGSVERAALALLASGRPKDQLRAAQMLASAYAEHEEQRLRTAGRSEPPPACPMEE